MTYYVTYTNLVGSVASIVGVTLFQRFLSRGRFRVAFWISGLVKLAASLFDYAIVKRYNTLLGISDSFFFMMGDAIIVQVVGMLELMPAVVLTSKVCPPGMEASVYALLVSYQNLGNGVARTIGVGLIELLHIRTNEKCDFTHLPLAILIAHVALPALSFPLVFFLIPDARMTDDLITPGPNDEGIEDPAAEFATLDSDDSGESSSHQQCQSQTSANADDVILPKNDTQITTTADVIPAETESDADDVQLLENHFISTEARGIGNV